MSKLLKNFLAEYGYNIVALPKEDIKPLLLLAQDGAGVISIDAAVSALFYSDEQASPSITSNTPTADIVGSTAASFDSETGISVLGWLLDKLKLGKLETKLNLDSNKILTFKYQNVKEDKVNLVALDGYLTEATPVKDKFKTFQAKLMNGELYVINAILKSNTCTLTIEDKRGTTADVDATIRGIASINQNIKSTSNNSVNITGNTEAPLVFAFKAQHIFYDKPGFWSRLFQPTDTPGGGFRIKNESDLVLRGPEDYPTEPLKAFADQSLL